MSFFEQFGSLTAMDVVDKCSLLWQRIMHASESYVELFAVIGALYAARKCIGIICESYNFLRVYFTLRLFGRIDFVTKYGSWAIVTGATAGIGEAYAEELARRGVNLILIARNKQKLERVKQAIAETHKVKIDYIVADFSKGREIYPSIKKALSGVDVGILVNNVGVFTGYPDYFCQVEEDMLWDIVNVNVVAATMMMKIVLPGMLDRKKGAIVNITSGTANRSIPLMAQYSASKVYLASLTRTLQYEYSSSGIFFQNVTPFFTLTNMTSFSDLLRSLPLLVPTAATYSRQAVATIGKSTKTAGYWTHEFQALLQMSMPECLWMYLMGAVNLYLRQEGLSRKPPQSQQEH